MLTLIKKIVKENLKFDVGYHEKISKYKNFFAKGYVLNWSEEGFVIKKIRNTVRGYM